LRFAVLVGFRAAFFGCGFLAGAGFLLRLAAADFLPVLFEAGWLLPFALALGAGRVAFLAGAAGAARRLAARPDSGAL
jgi:hypothetical protein